MTWKTTTPPISRVDAAADIAAHASGITALNRRRATDTYLASLEGDAPAGVNVDLTAGTLEYDTDAYTDAAAARAAYAQAIADRDATARRITADEADRAGSLDWRDRAAVVVGLDAKAGNWTKFTNLAQSGMIMMIINRARRSTTDFTGDARTPPLAAVVDAAWARRINARDDAPYTTTQEITSYEARQYVSNWASDVNRAAGEGVLKQIFVARNRRQGHTRTYGSGTANPYTRTFTTYPGEGETIAFVPIPWLARVLDTTVAELEQVQLTEMDQLELPEELRDAG